MERIVKYDKNMKVLNSYDANMENFKLLSSIVFPKSRHKGTVYLANVLRQRFLQNSKIETKKYFFVMEDSIV